MKVRVLFIVIAIFAFVLRFWQLGENPPSLDWDEASLGYNAYSLLKTGRDEYGTLIPLAIRSFGDYKPPLYTYLTVLPVALLGLNEFSVRFTSAFFGILTVLVSFQLTKIIFPKSRILPLLVMFFLAISPWHLQFSRTAFESNLALFFISFGILSFLQGVSKGRWLVVSGLFFGISLYAYHSPRLIAPVLILGLTLLFIKRIWLWRLHALVGLSIFILMFIPIILSIRSMSARYGSVSAVNPDEKLGASIAAMEFDLDRGDFLGKLTHNRRIVFAREILGGYLDHFNFDFLFLTGDAPGRHHASGMGMLYLFELPFILIGIIFLIRQINQNVSVIFLLFLTAPLASAITSGTPHAVRALAYLPTYQIIAAAGICEILNRIKNARKSLPVLPLFQYFIVIVFMVNIFYYLRTYYFHTPVEYSQWWQFGYKQVVTEVSKIANRYERIIVTYAYDQPYVYFLFYNQVDPYWYQSQWHGEEIARAERKYGKYEFRYLDWENDSKLQNTILVGTPEEIPKDAPGLVKEVKFLDGKTAFRIVARD